MRKQTAPRTRKHQAASPPQQSGLIAREKNAQQSATPPCALDNRFHRTDSPRVGHAVDWEARRRAREVSGTASVKRRPAELNGLGRVSP